MEKHITAPITKEIAKELLKIKMPIEQIIQITKLPKEEIEKYK